jgi:hypothetical protein
VVLIVVVEAVASAPGAAVGTRPRPAVVVLAAVVIPAAAALASTTATVIVGSPPAMITAFALVPTTARAVV